MRMGVGRNDPTGQRPAARICRVCCSQGQGGLFITTTCACRGRGIGTLAILASFLFVFCKFSFECACWYSLSPEEASPCLPLGSRKRGHREVLQGGLKQQCPSLSVCSAYHSQHPCWEVPRVRPTYRQGNGGSEKGGSLSGYIQPGAWS